MPRIRKAFGVRDDVSLNGINLEFEIKCIEVETKLLESVFDLESKLDSKICDSPPHI
ncbi:MAG: hypothetical protein K2P17_05940 [Helicobacteraceae bacterium]|nr:hypothetical protein [Helicobacteraceae bacterium]